MSKISKRNRIRQKTDENFLIPSSFYEDIIGMSFSELKVTLAMYSLRSATTSKIREVTGLSKPSVLSGLHAATKRGTVTKEEGATPINAELAIRRKTGQELESGGKICTWCYCSTLLLHAHHFPTPKSKGGTDTVDICPNCHAEYHEMVRPRYVLCEQYTKVETKS